MSELLDLNQIEKEAREEFEAEKSQGAGGAGGALMEIVGMDDDYDYYESQSERYDRIKARAKPFGRLPFHPSMIQRTRKHVVPQLREEAGDILATLVCYLNRDIKKIYSYDKKMNVIYSVEGYTTAVGFGDPEHYQKRNWKKQYYTDVNDLERTTLAAKLKQQDKQGYDSQRRRTPPIVPPIVPLITLQIQALPELQPLNQSPG
ncbi:MAG: hypothetical protein EZS28_014515 [Streblomastix strix]|uniref:Uncharacterized protein n=1 Tax=Streblomastix strix TaxID=222440 RepID=A0A5J4W4W4_9EUKA|nr:MAG: hypothetical protein EZS28_014515 [Streblomastix strix]